MFKKINKDDFLNNIYKNKNLCDFFKLNDNTEIFFCSVNYDKSKRKTYLELLILFYEIEKYIESKKANNFISNEEDYFIVNKDWIESFNSILNYNEILTNEIKNLINEDSIKLVDKIFDKISDEDKNNLSKIEEDEKLQNIDLYKIDKKNIPFDYNTISYFSNFGLINSKIIDKLKKININVEEYKLEKIKCSYIDDKIIVDFPEKGNIINIGHYENNLFVTEKIIYTTDKDNIKAIKDIMKSKGYNYYLKYLLDENEIIEENNIQIIEISKTIDQYNFNKSLISEKLKAFILLSIYHQKIIEKTKKADNNFTQELDEVFLINKNWLDIFGYDKIYTLVRNHMPNEDLLNNNDIELFNNYIFKLNKNEITEIKEIDKNLNNLDLDKDNFYISHENITLLKNKNINIYNNFIVINKKINDLFCDSFKINKKCDSVKFYSSNNKNLIKFNNNNQYTILVGSILNNENKFNLEYIIDIDDYFYLDEVFTNYIDYINNNLIITPIFKEYSDSIIGYAYKYENKKKNNYKDYLITNEFINIIHLVNY